MLELPADLVIDRAGSFGRPEGSCLRGIGGRAEGVRSHVGDARGLCGRTGGRHSSRGRHAVRSTTSDEAPANFFSGTQLAASESSRPSDRFSRAVIFRSLRFEQAQYSIGAVRCPQRDNATIGFAQSL
jgi:hypothetical protein